MTILQDGVQIRRTQRSVPSTLDGPELDGIVHLGLLWTRSGFFPRFGTSGSPGEGDPRCLFECLLYPTTRMTFSSVRPPYVSTVLTSVSVVEESSDRCQACGSG